MENSRGLATCAADKMNLESAAGAWGTIIFWKQVGHSSCEPVVLESAVMCCPQTGQANLNSLIALAINDSTVRPKGQFFFPVFDGLKAGSLARQEPEIKKADLCRPALVTKKKYLLHFGFFRFGFFLFGLVGGVKCVLESDEVFARL